MVPKPASYAQDEATLLQSRLRQSLSLPAGSTGPDALQGTVGPFDFQGTLLTQIQFSQNEKPQIPFHRAALHSSCPSLYTYLGSSHFKCRMQHLLNFRQLIISHPSNLSRLISLQGLCRSTPLPSLVSFTKFLYVQVKT